MNGEANASGWTAEPRSLTKPSPTSGAERVAPPGSGAASRTTTDRPVLATVMAAARPFGPDPTTTTSTADGPVWFGSGVVADIVAPRLAGGGGGERWRPELGR